MSDAKSDYMENSEQPDFCPLCLSRDSTTWPTRDGITGHIFPMCEICEKERNMHKVVPHGGAVLRDELVKLLGSWGVSAKWSRADDILDLLAREGVYREDSEVFGKQGFWIRQQA